MKAWSDERDTLNSLPSSKNGDHFSVPPGFGSELFATEPPVHLDARQPFRAGPGVSAWTSGFLPLPKSSPSAAASSAGSSSAPPKQRNDTRLATNAAPVCRQFRIDLGDMRAQNPAGFPLHRTLFLSNMPISRSRCGTQASPDFWSLSKPNTTSFGRSSIASGFPAMLLSISWRVGCRSLIPCRPMRLRHTHSVSLRHLRAVLLPAAARTSGSA